MTFSAFNAVSRFGCVVSLQTILTQRVVVYNNIFLTSFRTSQEIFVIFRFPYSFYRSIIIFVSFYYGLLSFSDGIYCFLMISIVLKCFFLLFSNGLLSFSNVLLSFYNGLLSFSYRFLSFTNGLLSFYNGFGRFPMVFQHQYFDI